MSRKRLPEPESELRQIVADLIEGVILVGPHKSIQWANAAACRMHGVGDVVALGRSAADYRKRFQLRYRNQRRLPARSYPIDRLLAGEAFSDVIVEVTPRGKPDTRWVHRVRSLLLSGAKSSGDRVLFLVDVTEWADAEQRFEQAFNANPAPALICRLRDLHYVKVNRGFLLMSGFSSRDVLDRSIYQVDVFEHAEDRKGAIKQLIAGETIPQMHAELRLPDGGSKLVVVAGQPIMLNNDPCMLLTFVDLESRRRVENSLRKSEERFKKAFRMMPTPTLMCTSDGFELFEVNEAFEQATGYTAKEVLDRPIDETGLIGSNAALLEIAHALRKTGSVRNFECAVKRKDGETIDCLLCAETVHLEENHAVLMTLLDITSRKRTEVELAVAIDAAMKDASWFSRTLIERLANVRRGNSAGEGTDLADLTRRERDVLVLLCEGLHDKEIAARLNVSPSTVRNHVAAVYAKLDVHSRSEAIVWAHERGFPRAVVRSTERPARDRTSRRR